MKVFAWLLLLLNIGLAVYFNLDRLFPSAPTTKWADMNPEKISLLTETDVNVLPKLSEDAPSSSIADLPTAAPIPDATPATSCFEWGLFSDTHIESAQNAAAQLSLKTIVKQQATQSNKRFWVFIPPFKSAQVAQIHAAELKALGVEDLFVVQEPKWKNAISFGLFEDETLAQKLLKELQAKGVKNVEKSLWNPKGQASLIFKQLSEDEAASLNTIKSKFPEAKLKKIGC